MRLGFFGDVIGSSGREGVISHLPSLRRRLGLEFVVINAENAAGGFGLTARIADELFEAGADVLTLGNHSWDQREMLTHIEREPRILRPVNYPPHSRAPGRGANLYDTPGGRRVLVVLAHGRVHMDALDDPFAAVDRELEAAPLGQVADAVIVDMHAEITSEKMAMGHFCDGRASLVCGTHTHVPTADAQVLPGGTAFQTDAGGCCDYDSVIGMEKTEPVRRFSTRLPGGRNTPALGPATVCGVFVETDDRTGLALRIDPIRVGGRLKQAVPETTPLPLAGEGPQGRQHLLHLPARGLQRAAGVDDEVGAGALLGVGKLAGEDGVELGRRHAHARQDPLPLHLGGGGDDGGGVDAALASGLEQQRHVDDHHLGVRGLGEEGGPVGADERMDHRLQPLQRLGVADHARAQRGPVDAAVGAGDAREGGLHRRDGPPAGRVEHVHRRVRVVHGSAERLEHGRGGRLAHADRAGEAEHDHAVASSRSRQRARTSVSAGGGRP